MTLPQQNQKVCTECKCVLGPDANHVDYWPEKTCPNCRRIFCPICILTHECRLLKYKMVFLVRKDLNMSAGKIAAQVAHAAVDLIYIHDHLNKNDTLKWNDKVWKWHDEGGKKVVLSVENEDELNQYIQLAADKGLDVVKIQDYGLTEVPKNSITVAGIGPALSDDIDIVTGGLKTLK